jgi:hypothetical protein
MKTRLLVAFAAGTFLVAGCSASATNFKEAAEKAILGIAELPAGSKASCESPTDTKVGTTFDCTATLTDGTEIPLIATITDSKTVTVSDAP